MKTYKTAESVCAGHPDKLCDYIADSVLDACMRKDKMSRVACEVMASKGRIIVAGEITCNGKINVRQTIKNALYEKGYNPSAFKIKAYIHKQSLDIAGGVNTSLESRNGDRSWFSDIGAGDQGTVYGYATDETREMLPLPLVLSHRICKALDKARKEQIIKDICPDGKAQVTVEYENGRPKRIQNITVSVQHKANKNIDTLSDEIISKILWPCFNDFPFDDNTELLINPSGRFVIGGPSADTGLTGRKIMVDTYGGLASNGGGAFSGKDPTKVDRSGAYMARYISKNIVAAGLAKQCETAVSYAIGKADPVSVSVTSFGTGKYTDEQLTQITEDVFNMRPAAIIEQLHLRNVMFTDTSAYGHFNSPLFYWEYCDRINDLRKAAEKYGY